MTLLDLIDSVRPRPRLEPALRPDVRADGSGLQPALQRARRSLLWVHLAYNAGPHPDLRAAGSASPGMLGGQMEQLGHLAGIERAAAITVGIVMSLAARPDRRLGSETAPRSDRRRSARSLDSRTSGRLLKSASPGSKLLLGIGPWLPALRPGLRGLAQSRRGRIGRSRAPCPWSPSAPEPRAMLAGHRRLLTADCLPAGAPCQRAWRRSASCWWELFSSGAASSRPRSAGAAIMASNVTPKLPARRSSGCRPCRRPRPSTIASASAST